MNNEWIQEQFGNIDVNDARLQTRAVKIGLSCAEHSEKSLPGCFEDWAGLKAAYLFFSNSKISHQTLQQSHYQNVLEKARFSKELVLFIQDGSELLFNSHPWTQGLRPTADSAGNGLMFHSCLVARYDESKQTEILGLSYQEPWIRSEEKQVDREKESEVWLRTLKKSGAPRKNWISVGDRGNDIYTFLNGASEEGWKFVVRARHNRRVETDKGQERLFPWIRRQVAKSSSKIFLRAKGQEFSGEVKLEITWAEAELLPPDKMSFLPREKVTYIRVWCLERPKIEWLLVTNVPLENEKDVKKIIDIYRKRWLIEDYHKALKTGCRIEDIQLKQASRILAAFGMIGVMATQLLSIREHFRLCPTKPVEEVIPKRWVVLVERRLQTKLKTLKDFWHSLARLGGFIGRKSDGNPGWQTIWGGYTRLQDMLRGASLF